MSLFFWVSISQVRLITRGSDIKRSEFRLKITLSQKLYYLLCLCCSYHQFCVCLMEWIWNYLPLEAWFNGQVNEQIDPWENLWFISRVFLLWLQACLSLATLRTSFRGHFYQPTLEVTKSSLIKQNSKYPLPEPY